MRNAGPCIMIAAQACASVLAASIAQRRAGVMVGGSLTVVTARLFAAG